MRRFLVTILAIIGGLVVVLALVALIGAGAASIAKKNVPDETILELDLERDILEFVPDDPLAQALLGRETRLADIVEGLERASSDERVVGLVAKVGASDMGLATAQELRDAVIAFRRSGKKAVAFAETFGEVAPGNVSYYLATAFDEIYLQPSGDLGFTGLILESPFVSGTLQKLGLQPRLDHRYEYKNAMNMLTETEFTPAHEEAMRAIMDSAFVQMTAGIAEGRKMTAAAVDALADRGPFLGQEALDAGLVDGLAYRDEVYDRIEEGWGEEPELLYLNAYIKRVDRPWEKGDETIALIYGVGGVQRGKSEFSPFGGDVSMGSDTVTDAFRRAVADEEVKAILFRVDSPGGSYVASDAIWRETVKAKEAGKPVVVSMGNVAGSGGYFVAMAADKIVAQPSTITGSIGVVGGKFLTSEMWSKLGISWDSVATGERADIWTGLQDFEPEEWQRYQAWLDRVYQDFTSKVAQGRGLPIERVLEVARGRIWSGADAKELGLVDELGGMTTAIRLAREAAGIPEDADIRLKRFPERKNPLEQLLEKGPDSSEPEAAAVALLRVTEEVGPLLRALGAANLEDDLLRMPAVGEPR